MAHLRNTYLLISRTADIDFREGRFTVGSQFDPKELVFRNLLNAFGETSRPEVMYSFGPEANSPNFTARVVIVDPMDRVSGYALLQLTNSTRSENFKKYFFATLLKYQSKKG